MVLYPLTIEEVGQLLHIHRVSRPEVAEHMGKSNCRAFTVCEHLDTLREDLAILLVWSPSVHDGVLKECSGEFVVEVLWQISVSYGQYWQLLREQMEKLSIYKYDVILPSTDIRGSSILTGSNYIKGTTTDSHTVYLCHKKPQLRQMPKLPAFTPHDIPQEEYDAVEKQLKEYYKFKRFNPPIFFEIALMTAKTYLKMEGWLDVDAFIEYMLPHFDNPQVDDHWRYLFNRYRFNDKLSPLDKGHNSVVVGEIQKVATQETALGAAARLCEMYCSQEEGGEYEEVTAYTTFLNLHHPEITTPSAITKAHFREFRDWLDCAEKVDILRLLTEWVKSENFKIPLDYLKIYVDKTDTRIYKVLGSIYLGGSKFLDEIREAVEWPL